MCLGGRNATRNLHVACCFFECAAMAWPPVRSFRPPRNRSWHRNPAARLQSQARAPSRRRPRLRGALPRPRRRVRKRHAVRDLAAGAPRIVRASAVSPPRRRPGERKVVRWPRAIGAERGSGAFAEGSSNAVRNASPPSAWLDAARPFVHLARHDPSSELVPGAPPFCRGVRDGRFRG